MLLFDGGDEPGESVSERGDPFNLKLFGDCIDVHSEGGEGFEVLPGSVDVARQRGCVDRPVVAEGINGRRRDGIDGVGSDELVDVERVGGKNASLGEGTRF